MGGMMVEGECREVSKSGKTKSWGGGMDDDRGNGRGKIGNEKIWRFVEGLCGDETKPRGRQFQAVSRQN